MGIIFSTAVKSYLKGNILLLALEFDSVYAVGRVVNSAMSDSERYLITGGHHQQGDI